MSEKEKTLTHYQLATAQQKQKEIKEEKYKQRSKKRLSTIFTTKMKTSFIGAISSCENNFGFLWGHGKPEEDLTDEEQGMKKIWDEARAEILDNGNTQLRAALNEINNYSIAWDRYHMDLDITEKEGGTN